MINTKCRPNTLLYICIFAFVIRVIWAIAVPVIPLSDSNAYDVFAQNIWLHGTYGWTPDSPSSYWPVGTSAIYAILYSIFGHNYLAIVVFNIACSVGIIYFSFRLCCNIFQSDLIATIAASLLAIWPSLIFFTTILASELPYMLFSFAAIHFFLFRRELILYCFVSAVFFAMSYYVRPLASVTIAICILCFYLDTNDLRSTITRSFLCILTVIILVAPWSYRNFQLYGHVVTMSTNGGVTLWMGNTIGSDGGYMELPKYVEGLDEYSRNQVLKNKAIQYIKEEPTAFIFRTVKKFFKFHLKETIGVTWNKSGIESKLGPQYILPLKILSQLFWSVILFLSLIGLFMYLKNKSLLNWFSQPFILLWLGTATIHAIIVAQDRYHLPVIPIVASFAAYFIAQLFIQIRK